MGTNVLDFELKLLLGSGFGTLEGEVLKEVGSAVVVLVLSTGTGIDQTPTVAVLALGMVSVATVKPLARVVVLVLGYSKLKEVARPLRAE